MLYIFAMGNTTDADRFTYYISLELKGAVTAQNWSVTRLATATGRNKANISLWLNGKREIPLKVVYEICATIGIEPRTIIDRAYNRVTK